MPETTLPQPRRNTDVECLRCGAFNIPENRICGRCGASLPLVYDEEGKVFDWKQDPYYKVLFKQGASRGVSTQSVRWAVRVAILLFAMVVAFLILHHR